MSTTNLFGNPSVSDIEIKQYQLEGMDLYITAYNNTSQYVYVKITAKGKDCFGSDKNAVVYGVIPPQDTANLHESVSSLPCQVDPNSIKVERVTIFNMDKAIKGINKIRAIK